MDEFGAELYNRFLKGDETAFEELVALYERELYLFVNNILRDYHESKHIVIEAFAMLAIYGRKFKGRSSLKTYLFAIAKNLALRGLKARAKRHTHISYEDVMESLVCEGESPAEFVEREENRAYLERAMDRLNENYKTVLRLLYLEDRSYAQVGYIMKKSVKQISDLAYRAKAALKKELEKMDFTHP